MKALIIKDTMSSLEIAELTGKRHDNVMADIHNMLEELGLAAPDFSGAVKYINGKGGSQERKIFNLPKRECLILVSGYNLLLRTAIIDRWQERDQKAMSIISAVESIEYKGQIGGMIFSRSGIGYTNSKLVANKFRKRHADVIRVIEAMIFSDNKDPVIASFNRRNYALVEYRGENGETRKSYELTEQGFSFVARGFTGAKARRFKVEFINAFFAMRETMQERFTAEVVRAVLPETVARRQYVYVITNDENNFVKIGVAKNVSRRLKQLQTGSWTNLSVRYKSMVCSNAFSIEHAVHAKISEDRVMGEWYDIDVEEAIKLIEAENTILNTNLVDSYASNSSNT